MYRLLVFCFFIMLQASCNSDQLDAVLIPDNIDLDVDQDGDPDFKVVYTRQTAGDPIGNYEEVKLTLESSGINEVLKKESDSPVFLSSVDLIETEVETPLFWEVTNPTMNIITPIAQIRTDYEASKWNNEWTVFSAEEKESYLLGFKLLTGTNEQLGYIEFSVDNQTGEFVLIKTELL